MSTIALEFVPPKAAQGEAQITEDAQRVRELLTAHGLHERVNTLLIPGMIPEDPDRPVELDERIDVLDVHRVANTVLDLDSIVSQVTAFSSDDALGDRIAQIESAGVGRVVFVGVPRTMTDGAGSGATPAVAIERYAARFSGLGVILIPTRDDEPARFQAKLGVGANFALCQMLFSPRVAEVLDALEPEPAERRPEILLSFGYVPKIEERTGLVQWLIRDSTPAAEYEMEIVRRLAGKSFAAKKSALLDIYRSVTESVEKAGYPIGVHFECPYGFSPYAFEVFHAMLDAWTPGA